MDGRIGHFHCRVNLRAGSEMGQAVEARLDRLVAEQVLQNYSAALEQVLGDDPAVYVIHRVHFNIDLSLSKETNENWVARRWGNRMAGAVVRQIQEDSDLVRFENQADYVVHFVQDLLANQAWDHWVYKPFSRYQSLGQAGALRAVLSEDPALIPAILAGLYRLGILERVLGILGEAGQRELWEHSVVKVLSTGTDAEAEKREQARPFFEAAALLAGRMEMWAGEPPSLDSILAGLGGSWQPPDWRDRQSLSQAVSGVLQVMGRRGWLRSPGVDLPEQRLSQALAELDWLDTSWLYRSVLELCEELQRKKISAARPGLTPRRSKLLADLLSAIRSSGLKLQPDLSGVPTNLLRLQAALIAYFPEWQNDPLSSVLVEEIQRGWGRLVEARDPAGALESLMQGDLERALRQFPERRSAKLEADLRSIIHLGAPAGAVFQALVASQPPDPTRREFDSRCAGTALLLRAILDARLPALLSQTGFPDPAMPLERRLQTTLLELFLSWAGPAGKDENGKIDPLLLILAGWGEESPGESRPGLPLADRLPDPERQAEIAGAAARFQAEWLRQLSGFGISPAEHPTQGLNTTPVAEFGQDLVRLWARWLRNFSSSSLAYLLENFIDRPGRVMVSAREIRIDLQPGSLDVVLEMAGYLDPLESIPWIQGKRISFH